MMGNKGLIIVPYAYGGNTGVSIQNVDKQLEVYMKNVCVSAISAKKNAGEQADVIVVSNITLPEPYFSLLLSNNIAIERCPFDRFNFGEQTRTGKKVRWQLAYYKLCALAHCIDNFRYNYYCFLDTDVYIQRSFEWIWKDAQHNIMLYDVNEPSNGYMVKEMQEFLGNPHPLTHYGGEFFAASTVHSKNFIYECEKVFEEMIKADFISENGDEFITSIAAARLKNNVKNAGAYIRRYWTGSYRLICDDYEKNNICILHMPAEKEQGMITLYNRFVAKGKFPRRETVWSLLHLMRPSIRVCIGRRLRRWQLIK